MSCNCCKCIDITKSGVGSYLYIENDTSDGLVPGKMMYINNKQVPIGTKLNIYLGCYFGGGTKWTASADVLFTKVPTSFYETVVWNGVAWEGGRLLIYTQACQKPSDIFGETVGGITYTKNTQLSNRDFPTTIYDLTYVAGFYGHHKDFNINYIAKLDGMDVYPWTPYPAGLIGISIGDQAQVQVTGNTFWRFHQSSGSAPRPATENTIVLTTPRGNISFDTLFNTDKSSEVQAKLVAIGYTGATVAWTGGGFGGVQGYAITLLPGLSVPTTQDRWGWVFNTGQPTLYTAGSFSSPAIAFEYSECFRLLINGAKATQLGDGSHIPSIISGAYSVNGGTHPLPGSGRDIGIGSTPFATWPWNNVQFDFKADNATVVLTSTYDPSSVTIDRVGTADVILIDKFETADADGVIDKRFYHWPKTYSISELGCNVTSGGYEHEFDTNADGVKIWNTYDVSHDPLEIYSVTMFLQGYPFPLNITQASITVKYNGPRDYWDVGLGLEAKYVMRETFSFYNVTHFDKVSGPGPGVLTVTYVPP